MRESRSSKLERHRWGGDALTVAVCLAVLAGPWLLLWHITSHWKGWPGWYARQGILTTLVQVVPATVVAVFIFAIGAIFVMVQIISPTLGSRAIEDLLTRRRARVCVIAGMVLLVACLTLATLARVRNPELWEYSAASALALASLVYVPFSIWCISSLFHDFVSPRSYSMLLSQRRGLRLLLTSKRAIRPPRRLWSLPLTSEEAFRRLRALRQWLRTACRTGESRDILFALHGFQELLDYYCDEVRPEEGSPNQALRNRRPAEYSDTGEVVHSRWRTLLDPSYFPPDDETWRPGWFGNEFGMALARCAEVGIQSGLLLRDLDCFLVVLSGATLELAGFRPLEKGGIGSAKRPPLRQEAGFLLDRIAEIGMYACQVEDKAYSDWFVRLALFLASIENKLEELENSYKHKHQQMQEPCLAGRSLAAWCIVNYAIQQSKDGANPQGNVPTHGRDQLGTLARNCSPLWDEAKAVAQCPDMRPSWMPPIRDEPQRQHQLSTFLDDVQALAAPNVKPARAGCRSRSSSPNWLLTARRRGRPAPGP